MQMFMCASDLCLLLTMQIPAAFEAAIIPESYIAEQMTSSPVTLPVY